MLTQKHTATIQKQQFNFSCWLHKTSHQQNTVNINLEKVVSFRLSSKQTSNRKLLCPVKFGMLANDNFCHVDGLTFSTFVIDGSQFIVDYQFTAQLHQLSLTLDSKKAFDHKVSINHISHWHHNSRSRMCPKELCSRL